MATSREYAYFIKGNKVAIVERDRNNTSGLTSPSSVPSIDLPNSLSKWKSPQATVTDALEIEYVYSPEYRINDADDTIATSAYNESGGYLWFTVTAMSATAGDWVVIKGSDRWNGLHQVRTTISGAVAITFNTRYNGGAVTESSTLYKDVDVLSDESDIIDIPSYLSKGLVCYVRAQLAEDTMEMELAAYWMVRFRKILEKHENSKIPGPRRVMPGPGAII